MCLYPILKLFSSWCVKRVEASIRTGHEERFDSDDMHQAAFHQSYNNKQWMKCIYVEYFEPGEFYLLTATGMLPVMTCMTSDHRGT